MFDLSLTYSYLCAHICTFAHENMKIYLTMKRILTTLFALHIILSMQAATLKADTEYYLWLNIYEKLLGTNEEGNGPAISAYGTNTEADSYVFVAEASGTNGYVLLRQKSSGKYLAASNSSSYSVVFEDNRSTSSRFLWAVEEGTYSYLINKKGNSYLGVDGANKGTKYVPIFYDKPKGSHSQWSAIPVTGSSWDEARAAYVSEEYTNAQGVKEIDYALLKNDTINRSDAIDIHITANSTPISGKSLINLGSDRTWLIIDNITPSEVIESYLKYVKIQGKTAKNGSNCRVAIFLNGAAVIPIPKPVMTCQGVNGEFNVSVGTHTTLNRNNNTMTSFVLRRGYMATLASGTGYKGYSRVFVADHADLTVELPTALLKRVSSVYIKPWQYLSKKGWGNTSGTSGADKLRATWYWTWSAGYSSTTDLEYVPCRQHLYWPSADDVNSKTASAALSLNEPEHSEQHTSSQCSCGGTINSWKAYTVTEDFKAGAGRIGSPQPTELSYLTEYFNYVDNMANRCDFAVTHAYWDLASYNESEYANWFCNTKCKSVWNNTGRPLWLTEMEISASWNSTKVTSYEQNRKYLQVLLQKLEECPWIERYAIYGTDMWETYMFYDANPSKGLTPAGQVYRDHRATFAYNNKYTKVPTFWTPSIKTPTIKTSINETNQTLAVTITNPNGDMTEVLKVQKLDEQSGEWSDYYTETDYYKFDNDTLKYKFPLSDFNIDNTQLRVYVRRTVGDEINSMDAATGYVQNGNIQTSSKDAVECWTCTRSAANGYTKGTGDTYLEVWDSKAAGMQFDYYQDISGLPTGIYELSAAVFNTTDNVEGATVNGAVVLYAQADTVQYLAPVTEDHEMDYDKRLTIPGIVVLNGKIRIGIKNIGEMSARWAGGDEFKLVRTSDLDADSHRQYMAARQLAEQNARLNFFTDGDASAYVINPNCQRKNTYGWTVENCETSTGEASDGSTSNAYWNQWKSSAFTGTMSQDITYLPEGSYSVQALVRGSTNEAISLTATVLSSKGEESVSQTTTITPVSNVSPEGSPYKNGWLLIQTPYVIVRPGDTLRMTMQAKATTGSAWWSADDFGLQWQYVEPLPDGVEDIKNEVSGAKNEADAIYDIMGRRVLRPTKGIYIQGGKKTVVR